MVLYPRRLSYSCSLRWEPEISDCMVTFNWTPQWRTQLVTSGANSLRSWHTYKPTYPWSQWVMCLAKAYGRLIPQALCHMIFICGAAWKTECAKKFPHIIWTWRKYLGTYIRDFTSRAAMCEPEVFSHCSECLALGEHYQHFWIGKFVSKLIMSFTVAWFVEIARAAWSMAVSWMVWRERK
jgi:hypothetical protein